MRAAVCERACAFVLRRIAANAPLKEFLLDAFKNMKDRDHDKGGTALLHRRARHRPAPPPKPSKRAAIAEFRALAISVSNTLFSTSEANPVGVFTVRARALHSQPRRSAAAECRRTRREATAATVMHQARTHADARRFVPQT